MSEHQARFAVGEVVQHQLFGYRGVIVDVDATYAGTEEWYHEVAQSKPPRERPWYHVLVHGADHMTYVAERHLELDESGERIQHPQLELYFDQYREGRYERSYSLN